MPESGIHKYTLRKIAPHSLQEKNASPQKYVSPKKTKIGEKYIMMCKGNLSRLNFCILRPALKQGPRPIPLEVGFHLQRPFGVILSDIGQTILEARYE